MGRTESDEMIEFTISDRESETGAEEEGSDDECGGEEIGVIVDVEDESEGGKFESNFGRFEGDDISIGSSEDGSSVAGVTVLESMVSAVAAELDLSSSPAVFVIELLPFLFFLPFC